MIQEEKKQRSIRDELRDGLDFYNGIKQRIRRTESVSEQDQLALDGFQQELQLLAHSPGLLPDDNPFLDLYQDMQSDMLDITGERARIDAEWNKGKYARAAAQHDTSLAFTSGNLKDESYPGLPMPVQGLTRKQAFNPDKEAYESSWDVRSVTDDPKQKELGYFIRKDILDQPFDINEGLLRRANQLNGGEFKAEIVNGEPRYTLSDGVEAWDTTEQMGLWNRPDVKQRLRMSLMGQNPTHGLAEMPVLSELARQVEVGAEKAGIGGHASRRGVGTAVPGLKLPFEVPLGVDGSFRGDESEILADPLYARALSETVKQMKADGELQQGGWEAFTSLTLGLADIALFSKGLGAVGAVGKAALGTEGLVPMGMRAYAQASGMAASRTFAFPLNTHFVQTAALLSAYNAFGNLSNPDTHFSDDLWSGVGTAGEIALAGGVVKPLRALGVGLLSKTWVGNLARKIAPRIALGLDPTGMMGHTTDSVGKTLEGLKMLPSQDGTFRTAFAKLAMGGPAKEAIMRSVDAYGVGMHLGARQWAEAQPGYENLSRSDKIALYRRGLGSSVAQASGASFMLSGLAMAIPAQRQAVNGFLDSDAGRDLMRKHVEGLAHPDKDADVTANFELFDRVRAEDPKLADGIVKMDPAAQKRWQEYEAGLQGIRALMGWHPLEGEPPSAAKTAVEPLAEKGISDALPRFKALVDQAQGVMAQVAPEIKHPVYHVGEMTKEMLGILGFKDHKHAMNAVQEYLRVVEGNAETRYEYLKDVPRALFERALDWRDRQKKLPLARGNDTTLIEQLGAEMTGAAPTQRQLELEATGDEFKMPPARREPRQLGIGEAAMTTAEVGRAVERAEGNPVYRGKAPGEIAVEMKQKRTKRRPSLGHALELVSSGKKDAAWLRAQFPEGAAHVGDGPVESWAGKFDRAVRAVWTQRSTDRLQKMRGNRPYTLRDYARKGGGLAFHPDLESLTGKEEGGRRPIVRSQKSKGGSGLDAFGEAAFEEGFFHERPTEAEVIDALHDDLRHPVYGGADDGQQRAEQEHAEQLVAYRERIESGIEDMPDDSDARRSLLFDAFAGDARFHGMTPERVEREVMALRAEAEIGAPAPEDAAPPMDAAGSFQRAASQTRRFVETLQWAGILPANVTASDAIVPAALVEVSMNSKSMEAAGVAKFGEGGWARVVEAAKMIRAQHRDAMVRALTEEGRKPEVIKAVEDTFAAIDAKLKGQDLAPEVRDRLTKGGRMDEHGQLFSRWEMLLVEEAARASFDADRRAREQTGEAEGFGSFIPPIAFSGRTWTHVEETTLGKMIGFSNWMDQPGTEEFLSNHPFARGVVNWAQGFVGPFSGPIQTAEAEMMKRAAVTIGERRAQAGWPQIRMSFALSRLFQAWQGARPPEGDLKFAYNLFDSGAFKNVRGPEDLERMRTGSGYMWQSMTEVRDVLQEFGLDWVQAGWMTQAQLDKLGGGGYMRHMYVREQQERDSEQLGRGQIPVKYFGLLLPRKGGEPAGVSLTVDDFLVVPRISVHEQATLRRALFTLQDIVEDPSYWKTAQDIGRMNAYERSRYQVAAVRTTMKDAALDKGKPRFVPEAARLGIMLQGIEKRMAAKGEEPASDQIAYSEKVDKTLKHYLGESERGKVFLPKALAAELDLALSEVYMQGGDRTKPGVFGQGFGHFLDQAGSWWKRGRTVLRTQHWTQQIVSNLLNNHGAHRLPIADAVGGLLGGPSFTRDAMQGFAKLSRWISEGLPKVRPQGWTEDDWSQAQAAKAFHDLAGGSSYALTGLSPDMAESFGLALDNHNVVRDQMMREAKAKAAADGWGENQLERVNRSVVELTGRLQSSLEPIDEAIGKMIGSPDPVAHARAFGAANALYLYMDLALFKYPAYLKAKHEWPHASPAELVAYSTAAAGDMRNSSAGLRRHLSMHSPYNSELWRSTTPNAGAKTAAAFFFRNRFWMWRNATVPTLLRATLRHPISGMTAAAIGGFGLKMLTQAITQKDPEDAERFNEEMRFAKYGALHQGSTPKMEREALERMNGKSKLPPVGGPLRLRDPVILGGLSSLWSTLANQFTAEAGKRVGETQYYDLRDLAGPWGEAAKTVGGAMGSGKLMGSLVAGDISRQKMVEAMGFGERMLGMNGQIAVSMMFGGPDDLNDALGGKTTWGESFIKWLQAFGRQMPTAYPVVGLISSSGQRIGENLFTGGMRFNDWAAGIERAYSGETSGGLLADSAASLVWPSRVALQQPALRSPTEAWSTLASAVMGESVDPATERGRRSLQAANFVARELSQVLGDLYQQHFAELGKPETTEIQLDDRVAGALRETFQHTVETKPDFFEIEPGYQPEGAILKAISGGSVEDRAARIKYLRRYASQESFKETGLNALFEAGRRAEMGVGLFRDSIRRTMTDPTGTNLLGWWYSQIKGGNKEAMEALAPLINDTPQPSKGSEAYGYWRDILAAYWGAGMQMPMEMSDEQRAAIEKRAGTHLMLQGGKPLTNALRSRSLLEGMIPK